MSFHVWVCIMNINPRQKIPKKPTANPSVENHKNGTAIPATSVEKSICENACPEAAVPLILGKQSKAANEMTGMIEAIPML